jgi:hypothetical protein
MKDLVLKIELNLSQKNQIKEFNTKLKLTSDFKRRELQRFSKDRSVPYTNQLENVKEALGCN